MRFLVYYLMLTCCSDFATADSNVGCLFNANVCEPEEVCFDDNAFGRCRSDDDLDSDFYRYSLDGDGMKLMEKELARLFDGGYRWENEYTQCVVQYILFTKRFEVSYDPGLCSRVMMMTLPEVPPELIPELEDSDPNELAMIKFTPSRGSNENFIYADEKFSPPLQSDEESRDADTPPDEGEQKKRLAKKESPGDAASSQPPDRDALFRRLLEVAKDTEKLFALEDDLFARLPSTSQSADLPKFLPNRLPIFTEGGTEYIPVDRNGNKFGNDEPEESEKIGNGLLADDEHSFNYFLKADRRANLAPGREEKPYEWSWTHKKPAEEEDPFRKYKTERDEQDMNKDNTGLEGSVESDYFEGNMRAMLPLEQVLSTFQRPMRYDIKKPGPTYFYHDDEDGVSNEKEEQDSLKKDDILAKLMADSRKQQLDRVLEKPTKEYPKSSPGFSAVQEDSSLKEQLHIEFSPNEIEEVERNDTNVDPSSDANVKRTYLDSPMTQPEVVEGPFPYWVKMPKNYEKVDDVSRNGEGHLGQYDSVDATRTYLVIKEKEFAKDEGEKLVKSLEKFLGLSRGTFSDIRADEHKVSFKVNPNYLDLNASDTAAKAEELSSKLKTASGLTVEAAGIGDQVQLPVVSQESDRKFFILTFVLCGAVVGSLLVVAVVYVIRRHARSKEKLQNIAQPDREASQDYQDLCRQRMASKANEGPEAVHSAFSPKKMRSLSQGEGPVSSSSHSSTSSWNEEPVTSNMDISTGHMILSYMEDHLKKKDRLDREWEAMCAYEAEPCSTANASLPQNVKKNRYPDVLPYDHSRVVLNELSNVSGSDYINGSSITDHDPRNPAYIATQGPLPHTAADFWQMVWEQGSVVMVMLTRLMENGVAMCHRHWPEEGSEVYHIYEVHLVSEHIWCDDYLVRSFYLKNLRTGETRTVTQFHFLSWPDNGVPNSSKALLEFRRKVNKSYRGRSCPIVVHCSDGIGRSGTYILIDMVLNRMAKGAKEIDIAATLEHVRDQRVGMVKTKAQFEFVLMAIAEEVHAILKALSQ